MTNFDYILTLCGTALGGAVGKTLLDSVINRNKNKLETQLKEQVFYKTLIEDMAKQHKAEQEKINELEAKIDELTKEVHKLITLNDEKDFVIAEQRKNLLRWEEACKRAEDVIKEKNKQISKLFEK